MKPQELIDERQQTHGDAWKVFGAATHTLLPQVVNIMSQKPKYAFAWLMILNKLIRATFAPDFVEHWRDIAGYAQLVLNDLEETK